MEVLSKKETNVFSFGVLLFGNNATQINDKLLFKCYKKYNFTIGDEKCFIVSFYDFHFRSSDVLLLQSAIKRTMFYRFTTKIKFEFKLKVGKCVCGCVMHATLI